MNRPWVVAGSVVASGLALAALQQQLLLQLPPRLLRISTTTATSGPAALDLEFSRPMQSASLARISRIQPPLTVQWLGAGQRQRLLIPPPQRIDGPISLRVGGLDRRGQAMTPLALTWDPRPLMVAVVPVSGGEQLQWQRRDGRWQALTSTFRRIVTVVPLANGSGITFVTAEGPGRQRVWLLPLEPNAVVPEGQRPDPRPGPLRRLDRGPVLYAHVSGNRRGDVIVQSAPVGGGGESLTLWYRHGGAETLSFRPSGPVHLLPEGGAALVPALDGLSLVSLSGGRQRPQILPGSWEPGGFCPRSGRALLVRHWPDFRRSVHLVEPGAPPRQIWLGSDAVLGLACRQGGEFVWLLVRPMQGERRLRLLEINRQGRLLRQLSLDGWQAEAGAPMVLDSTTDRLLLTLRSRRGAAAQSVVIETSGPGLRWRPVARPVIQAQWLPVG